MALPFFLCAVTALLYLFAFSSSQAKEYRALTEKAEALAVAAGQTDRNDPYLTLYNYNTAEAPFPEYSFGRQGVIQRVTVRTWIGYTGERLSNSEQSDLVYQTPEGTVYHESAECTHLRLSTRTLSSGALPGERNQSGGRYAPCEYCVGNAPANARVYVTDYGDRYHNESSCQGLKRTILVLPREKAVGEGLRACSRCGT